MIEGGYILQPRCLDGGSLAHHPPVDREVWAYLLRNVLHKDKGSLKRGQGYFQLSDIQENLYWVNGRRKMTYSKPQLTKAIQRICATGAAVSRRVARGIIVTIMNYDLYQSPMSYCDNNVAFCGNAEIPFEETEKSELNYCNTDIISGENEFCGNAEIPFEETPKNKNNNTRNTSPTNVVEVYGCCESISINPVKDQNAGARERTRRKAKLIRSENDPKTWREDFEIYKDELRIAYNSLMQDSAWISTQQRFNPHVNIQLSLEKACVNYWATEAAWQRKRKQRIKTINWRQTLTNALSQPQNKVFNDNRTNQTARSTNGVSDDYKMGILETLLGGRSPT